jgi:alkanesulfonate monooxygenase SsuD/methylene tetrahydromethanopterin reductase-like flavin-dependent oxidoreductase (luciferase family)
MEAIEIYRSQFKPSAQCDRPYVMIGVTGIAADTDAEARRLFTSPQQAFANIVRGTRGRLRPPIDDIETYWSPAEKAPGLRHAGVFVCGIAGDDSPALDRFIEENRSDELMIASAIYDHSGAPSLLRNLLKITKSLTQSKVDVVCIDIRCRGAGTMVEEYLPLNHGGFPHPIGACR